MKLISMVLLSASLAIGCGAPMNTIDGGADGATEDPACAAEGLESDLRPSPLQGSAVDANGALMAGQYVFSTTRLKLRFTPAAGQRFNELMGPISTALASQPGLLAQSVATSTRCNVARTLTVWRDEASMYAFVSSSSHTAAMAAVSEVSRGGSRTTHWSGAQSQGSWEFAAQSLVASAGPTY